MAYGYAIYDDKGREITGLLTPMFVLGKYTQASGNITFTDQPKGKTLKAQYVGIKTWKGTMPGAPKLTVKGNNVTWSGLQGGESSYIYVYWG